MKDLNKQKRNKRVLRKNRIKSKTRGTKERPRLVVYKSLSHIYAQIIDDEKKHTMVFASDKGIKKGKKTEKAHEVGILIAQAAKEKKIEQVVFDRNGFLYHGRVKALADGAREGGLKF